MSNITIKKAKLIRGLFLEVEYTERTEDDTLEIKKKSNQVVHEDLKDSFQKLAPHLESLCEQPEESEITISGFTITGMDDGFVISGSRKLSNGKVLNLNSPNERWEDSEYRYRDEIGQLLEEAKSEIHQYLFEGKHAPKPQQEFDFPEEEEELEEA